MQAPTQAAEVDPAAMSQDIEYRLRSLEGAVMALIGEKLMTMKKIKMDKAEVVSDLETAASEIAFTIGHYPLE